MQQRIAALESAVTALAKSMNPNQSTLPASAVPQPAEPRPAVSEAEEDQTGRFIVYLASDPQALSMTAD